jgi:GH35 family endo-1,4-beta-xylanase
MSLACSIRLGLSSIVILFTINFGLLGYGQLPSTGERLRDIGGVNGKLIGFTAPYRADAQLIEEELFEQQANLGTIHLNSWNWTSSTTANFTIAVPAGPQNNPPAVFNGPRAQKEWLQSKGSNIQLHLLVGPQMAPDWLVNGNFQAPELEMAMQKWIQNVATEFGQVHSVIVVNEATNWYGQWRGQLTSGQTSLPPEDRVLGKWLQLGWSPEGYPNYIKKAFQYARQYFPNSKLIYNDFACENQPTFLPNDNSRSRQVYELCQYLKGQSLIDRVGFQCHFDITTDYAIRYQTPLNNPLNAELFSLEGFNANIARYGSDLLLPTHITELDIGIPQDTAAWRYEQGKWFGYITNMAARNIHVQAITFWGILDRRDSAWNAIQNCACLFMGANDPNGWQEGSAKDAYFGAQNGLAGICFDKVYRIFDVTSKMANNGEGNNIIVPDNPPVNAIAITVPTNVGTYALWKVKKGINGSFRLESVGFPGRFMQSNWEADTPVRIWVNPGSNVPAQYWTIRLPNTANNSAAWRSVILRNEADGWNMNTTSTSANAGLKTAPTNSSNNQNFFFINHP